MHRAGADPEFEANKLTELCWAAGKGRAGVVRALIEIGGADPQRVDTEGTNALMCAAYGGHPDAVQVLLDTGRLDPNATSKRGAITALMLAAGSPSPTASLGFLSNLSRGGVMQALYNLRGADEQRCRCVELLIRAGARVDVADDLNGLTPLLLAARDGNARAVQLLLQAGAKVDLASSLGVWGCGLGFTFSACLMCSLNVSVDIRVVWPGSEGGGKDDMEVGMCAAGSQRRQCKGSAPAAAGGANVDLASSLVCGRSRGSRKSLAARPQCGLGLRFTFEPLQIAP